jgi:hypothetical protein
VVIGGIKRPVDDRVGKPHRVFVDAYQPFGGDGSGEEGDPPVALAHHRCRCYEPRCEALMQGTEVTHRFPAVRRRCVDEHFAED